jgi:anthranilate phosphoribosyltransferase
MTDDVENIKSLISIVADGTTLKEHQAEQAFDLIMSGDATPSQIAGFLMALRVRGETVEEITGAARSMRAKATKILSPKDAMDNVGTGGDASGSYNISTASSFVVSAAGVPIAKHGNRALSSKTGAADVLTQLGVNLDCKMELVQSSMDEAGICFLMAPRHHTAMRHVAEPRIQLATRTIFNLLGPIANPADVTRQLVGVFSQEWVEPIAKVLKSLGSERAWVVHGSDGLDEITTTGKTKVASLEDGAVTTFEIHPAEAGIKLAKPEQLVGGEPDANANALLSIFNGERNAYRDIVILNSAACLIIAGKAENLTEGASIASDMIDSGKAMEKLEALKEITNR